MNRPLTATTLRAMADALDQLAQVSFARVSSVDIHGIRLTVRRHEDQRDGAWYELVSWKDIDDDGT